jgi:predicted DNA-binding transcriptional regulator YafY
VIFSVNVMAGRYIGSADIGCQWEDENMRASRLLSLLLLLQTRGVMTAEQLATELEVSVRTIYRDVDSLHAAGVPLYGDAGHRGGYRLMGGYRTRLTGLTAAEADALFLSGLPGPAAELGLGSVLAAAQLKVRAALPAALADEAGRIQARFHLDAAGWYDTPADAPFLTEVAGAVWRGRALQVRYRRWKEPTDVDRRLEPYGLVLKAGRWYLVAASAPGGPRTYRIDQILAAAELHEQVVIPEDFDLARYWQSATASFLDRLHSGTALVRLAPKALGQLNGAARAAADQGTAESGGWIRTTIPIESVDHAVTQFLALGTSVEVLEPAELRTRIAAEAAALAARYAAPVQ